MSSLYIRKKNIDFLWNLKYTAFQTSSDSFEKTLMLGKMKGRRRRG